MEGGCASTGVHVRWRGYVAALGYMSDGGGMWQHWGTCQMEGVCGSTGVHVDGGGLWQHWGTCKMEGGYVPALG